MNREVHPGGSFMDRLNQFRPLSVLGRATVTIALVAVCGCGSRSTSPPTAAPNLPRSQPGRGADEDVDLSGQTSIDARLEQMTIRLVRTRSLVLAGSDVTAAGLKHLQIATSLKSLDLRDTSITDADLQQLRGMEHLTFLALDGSRVTEAGMAEVRRLLPNTAITPMIESDQIDSPASAAHPEHSTSSRADRQPRDSQLFSVVSVVEAKC